jgi:heme a synthase
LVVPLWAGLAHQLLAMIVLATAVFHARRCRDPHMKPLTNAR